MARSVCYLMKVNINFKSLTPSRIVLPYQNKVSYFFTLNLASDMLGGRKYVVNGSSPHLFSYVDNVWSADRPLTFFPYVEKKWSANRMLTRGRYEETIR